MLTDADLAALEAAAERLRNIGHQPHAEVYGPGLPSDHWTRMYSDMADIAAGFPALVARLREAEREIEEAKQVAGCSSLKEIVAGAVAYPMLEQQRADYALLARAAKDEYAFWHDGEIDIRSVDDRGEIACDRRDCALDSHGLPILTDETRGLIKKAIGETT